MRALDGARKQGHPAEPAAKPHYYLLHRRRSALAGRGWRRDRSRRCSGLRTATASQAFLEASTARNRVPSYERTGFEVMEEFRPGPRGTRAVADGGENPRQTGP